MTAVQRFKAMGCEVLVAGASMQELRGIRDLFDGRERRFSRFIETSDLCRVNRRGGGSVVVSEEFAAMVRLAMWAAESTGGLVDPSLGAALVAAGYDRDLSLVGPGDTGIARAPAIRGPVELHGRLLTLPAGVALDLNGVVKSATVDDALSLLSGDGWVSAGGDLATRGGVGVALPAGGDVHLSAGGMATSGRTRRAWIRDGQARHHLIDPATAAPSVSPWEQVTVCGATCVDADVAAKAAFLLAGEGPAWLDERGIPGRFVTPGDGVVVNRGWAAATAQPAERACI